jgi:flagellar biosynthetic protein FliQ
MTSQYALDLAYLVIFTCAKISAPFLITAIVAGVLINILQTVTSIRDMTVTFVPKVIVAAVVTALALPWTIEVMINFFNQVFAMFADIGG